MKWEYQILPVSHTSSLFREQLNQRMWHRRPLTLVQTAGSEIRLRLQLKFQRRGVIDWGWVHYVAGLALD